MNDNTKAAPQGVAGTQSFADRVKNGIADHLADNMPMKRYDLAEIEAMIRSVEIRADLLTEQAAPQGVAGLRDSDFDAAMIRAGIPDAMRLPHLMYLYGREVERAALATPATEPAALAALRRFAQETQDECRSVPDYVAEVLKVRPAASDHVKEALMDVTAAMVGAASAYRTYAKRSSLLGKAETDPFFGTRVADMDKAVERARAALKLIKP